MPSLHLRNLIPLTTQFQARLAVLSEAVPAPEPGQPAAQALAAEARQVAQRVEALGAEHALLPAALPPQSRRAYQWLAFLADPANVAAAAAALALARHVLVQARWPRRAALAGCPVTIEFYPTAYLYRMRPEVRRAGAPLRVTLAPGYLFAPPDVLEAVLRTALGYGGAARARLHAYALSDDFAETTQALELATEPAPGSLRGAHFDLETVFERVNAAYFAGRLARPRLAWSSTVARRMLGYYQQSSDRLMISRALDDARVPAYAIEMVMYHELLHKHLGLQLVNGRQHAHTGQFRDAERRFQRFADAQAFLKDLGQLCD